MTITAVVVSHANSEGLEKILTCLEEQTRPPDEVLVYASGYDRAVFVAMDAVHPEALFRVAEFRDDWGHHSRAEGLEAATMDWVFFASDDCWYEPEFIERMLEMGDGQDVVYCGWNEQPGCVFASGSSDAGNFIVRREVGQPIGWPNDRVYENDGIFINRLNSATKQIVKVEEVLFHHNWQP